MHAFAGTPFRRGPPRLQHSARRAGDSSPRVLSLIQSDKCQHWRWSLSQGWGLGTGSPALPGGVPGALFAKLGTLSAVGVSGEGGGRCPLPRPVFGATAVGVGVPEGTEQ